MKKTLILLIILAVALSVFGKSLADVPAERVLTNDVLEYSNLGLRVTNYGCMGKLDTVSPGLLWPNLISTPYCEHLYQASLWIGAECCRRNGNGMKLYWLPDATSEDDVVTQDDPPWTQDLEVVMDTLTSVGFDGDLDLKELLPAYNPLEISPLPFFDQYNNYDILMKGCGQLQNVDDDNDGLIDEDNLGRPFAVDDAEGTWCFTGEFDEDGDDLCDEDWDYPGFETSIAYLYDYSPFGTETERDWGDSKGSSSHYPLGLAIEQQTWSYPVFGLEDIVFINWKIHNTSAIDTLKYLSVGMIVDADVGPIDWTNISQDDVSSYNTDHEYAFSYDFDGDQGLSTSMLAAKMINCEYGFSCWTWDVGDGPNDTDPRSFYPPSSATSHNDKYWLMTNFNNPNEQKYTSLRDFPNSQVNSGGLDSRFVYSVYGAMPHTGDLDNNGILDYLETDESGNYFKRFNLSPLESRDYTAILFMGNNEEELIERCQAAEEFYASGYDISLYDGQPSVPIINSAGQNNHQMEVNWLCATMPDALWLRYKDIDAPALEWTDIQLNPENSNYTVSEITESGYYEFIIGVTFDGVYLESKKETRYFDPVLSNDPNEIVVRDAQVHCYPNPFNPETSIEFEMAESGKASVEIYNLKGRKVTTLVSDNYEAGKHTVIWNAADQTSGIYLLKFKTAIHSEVSKLVLLK